MAWTTKADLLTAIRELSARTDARFDAMDARFDDLSARTDTRFDGVHARLDAMNARIDTVIDTLAEFRTEFLRHRHDN